jgi:hypothetical protein
MDRILNRSINLPSRSLDKHLNWKDHVEEMSMNTGIRLKIMSRIRAYLTLEAAKAVYNGLISLIFDYCDVAWAQWTICIID